MWINRLFPLFQCYIVLVLNGPSMCKLLFDLRTNIILSESKPCFDFWVSNTNILQHSNSGENVSLKICEQ